MDNKRKIQKSNSSGSNNNNKDNDDSNNSNKRGITANTKFAWQESKCRRRAEILRAKLINK